VHPEAAGLELDDGHAGVGGDAAEPQCLLLLEQPYPPLHRLGADGAAVEERPEREGEPGEVEVEPLGTAAFARRLGGAGGGGGRRDGEARPRRRAV
jgi:hypothetical protein